MMTNEEQKEKILKTNSKVNKGVVARFEKLEKKLVKLGVDTGPRKARGRAIKGLDRLGFVR